MEECPDESNPAVFSMLRLAMLNVSAIVVQQHVAYYSNISALIFLRNIFKNLNLTIMS